MINSLPNLPNNTKTTSVWVVIGLIFQVCLLLFFIFAGPGLFIIGTIGSLAFLGDKAPDILTPIIFYCLLSSVISIIIGLISLFFRHHVVRKLFTISFCFSIILGVIYLYQISSQFNSAVSEKKVENTALIQFDTAVYSLLESIPTETDIHCGGWNGITKKRDTFCTHPMLLVTKNTDLSAEEYNKFLSILSEIIPHKNTYAIHNQTVFQKTDTGYVMKVEMQISPEVSAIHDWCGKNDALNKQLFQFFYTCELDKDATCQKRSQAIEC